MYSLNLKQINAFRAVMLTGSMTQASKILNISQPAVSRLLKEFEEQADLILFERGHGRLTPTAAAEGLFAEVERAYGGLNRLTRAIERFRSEIGSDIRLAASTPPGHGLLPRSIGRFCEAEPEVSVSLRILVRREMRLWLKNQEFDLAVMTGPIDYPPEFTEKLPSVASVCIMPIGHPLSERPVIRAEDLAASSFLSLTEESIVRLKMDAMLKRAGLERPIKVEAQSTVSVCNLVMEGVGVSVVDPISALSYRGRLEIRPFLPVIPYEMCFLYPIGRPPRREVSVFAETTRTCFHELMADNLVSSAEDDCWA